MVAVKHDSNIMNEQSRNLASLRSAGYPALPIY